MRPGCAEPVRAADGKRAAARFRFQSMMGKVKLSAGFSWAKSDLSL
ncbi:hypothetical protein [Sphingobium sp. SA916]